MRLFCSLLLVCQGIIMSHDAAVEQKRLAEKATVALSDNQFAVDLYVRLDEQQPGKNLFFSPTSITMALAMTAAGARGQTQTEMAKTLHLEEAMAQAHVYYHKLLQQWNADGEKRPYQLHVANRLWGLASYPIRSEFLALTRQQYDAEMTLLNFADAEGAGREINQWVEARTNNKIKHLISPGALGALTRLVLTNATYFKGDWVKPFDTKGTQEEEFTVSAERKVSVPLMHQTAAFGFAEEETLQLLEMPYAGRDLSMVVLLPKKLGGLPELETSLSRERLDSLVSQLLPREVNTSIPRFKLEASVELAPTLEALGMRLAFSNQADFSGISDRKGLYISAVVHKAFVDVNEEDTEAAAATAVVMRASARRMPQPIRIFRADHPFLFLIRDMHTGSVLFMGRVVDPTQ